MENKWRMFQLFVAAFCVVLLLAVPAHAQTPVYTQSISDAVTGDNTVLSFTHPLATCVNCWQPDLGADNYSSDLYERPMGSGSGASAYFPGLDITTTQIGADATYFYFRINMQATDPTPNAITPEPGLPYMYTWEINFDGADAGGDARPDLWVRSEDPRGKVLTTFGVSGVVAYLDDNDDAGGTLPITPQGPGGAGNGYETLVFDQGTNPTGVGGAAAIVARIVPGSPRSLEIAVRRDFFNRVKGLNAGLAGSLPVTTASFRGNAGKAGAGTTNANLLLHDKFGRLGAGSPYPWLTTAPAPTVACPDTEAAEAALSTQQRNAFNSGTNTNTAIVNPCYPHGGNIVEFDNSGGVNDLESGASFDLDPTLTGTVFEDVNYGGGAGRTRAATGAVVRPGARVELYNAAGTFVSAVTTDALGVYKFTGLTRNVSYTVRVVNSTVTSSRTGAVAGLLPVQTFRTSGLNAATGSPLTQSGIADVNRVGGETPSLIDAGNGATTLAALATATTAAQSITSVAVGTVNVIGIDFGFNFDTIVATRDAGQGSLRQFIINANTLGGDAALAQAGSRTDLVTGATVVLAAGVEQSIFMIPSGTAVAGLRAGLTNQLTAGRALIGITTALPALSTTLRIEGGTQTLNVGNTNNVTLGTGGTVGVGATALSQLNGPEVELRDGADGAAGLLIGLDVAAINVTLRGLAVVSFGGTADSDNNAGIRIGNFTGALINQNVLGTTAISFVDPGVPLRGIGDNLRITGGGDTGSITQNLIGYAAGNGISTSTTAASTGWLLENNEVRGNGVGATARNGIEWDALALGAGGNILRFNLIAANTGVGIDLETDNADLNLITQNTITTNGNATEPGGIRVNGGDTNTISLNIVSGNTGPGVEFLTGALTNTVSQNRITANTQSGIEADNGSTSNTFTQNSIFANTRIGIDLLLTAENATPVAPYYTHNDVNDNDTGANGVLNFPQLMGVNISAGNVTITGTAPAGATIEFFISDSDASGFGEGQTYLVTRVEGSADDTTTGTSPGSVTCAGGVNVVMNNFSFTFPTPSGVVGSTSITSTATLAANTSEFSCNASATAGAASLVFMKTVSVTSDSFNGSTNPKNIPGAEVLYNLRVTNTGGGTVSNNTVFISDPIPANTELFVGDLGAVNSGPIAFVQGTPSSNLIYTFASLASLVDDVDFSNDNGATWTFVPTAPYSTAVNRIRLNPKGTMAAASAGNNPFFELRFRVRIK